MVEPGASGAIHLRLARAERFRKGFPAALEGTRVALELADRLDDDVLRFDAARAAPLPRQHGRRRRDAGVCERAHELATATGDARLLRKANVLVSGMLFDSGDIDGGAPCSSASIESGGSATSSSAQRCSGISRGSSCGPVAGRLAADHAARARDVSVQYGVERNQDYIPSSWVAVHRGQLELAQAESERALKLCDEQIGFHPPLLLAVPGLVALWSGDAVTAADVLGKADRQAAALGWGAPDTRPWTADYAEALLELGRVDEAVRVIDLWEADARRLGRERVLAHVTRCRGLVAAASGAVDEAVSLLKQAIAQHDEVGDSFGRARALLALGIVLRRARQKRPAREAIHCRARRLRATRSSHLGRRRRVPSSDGSAGARRRKD